LYNLSRRVIKWELDRRERSTSDEYSINSKVFSRVVPRRVDSHRRRERRGSETDQRHDWKRTLASLHSLWELRNFPDGRHPFSNSVIRAVLFVLQMLLLFRQLGVLRNKAISVKCHWLFQLCVQSRPSGHLTLSRILVETYYRWFILMIFSYDIAKENVLNMYKAIFISYIVLWDNVQIM